MALILVKELPHLFHYLRTAARSANGKLREFTRLTRVALTRAPRVRQLTASTNLRIMPQTPFALPYAGRSSLK
jgi:hypothetical protein